jgi:urea transport system permease protein
MIPLPSISQSRHRIRALLLIACAISCIGSFQAAGSIDLGGPHPDRIHLIEAILAPAAQQPELIETLIRYDDPAIAPVLQAFVRGGLFHLPGVEEGRESLILLDFSETLNGRHPVVSVMQGTPLIGENGEPLMLPADQESVGRFLRTNSRVRRSINRIVEVLEINSPNWRTRLNAVDRLGNSGNPDFLPFLQNRIAEEPDRRVQKSLSTSVALLQLNSDAIAVRREAMETLVESRSLVAKARLESLLEGYRADPESSILDADMAATAVRGIRAIEGHWKSVNFFADLFRGLSLGSVLLMMAMGLAITFGLMGVINMAHGELMVVGAYATFVTQNLFASWFGAAGPGFSAYFLCAIPVAFFSAALVGLILERSIIQFLYRRPLESLLATWGVSLALQQLFRVIFGPANVQINSPSYLTGNMVLFDIVFAYNRVFVIGFTALLVLGVWLLLTRTPMGLNIRAVMQNRAMAACMGVRTQRVNMMTFAFGSGLAGIAGACLTQLTNVGPSLGQNHIVDTFMVVVAGGVGSIFGTVIAALSIGAVDQILQPVMGAVMGKITVLFAIILFLQWRPGGLIPTRSRNLD